ncbi:ankyrin repeat-containing domain protein [Tuber indicum]|nr:ankyrin repeat-containing domain protein [Tuber indicum]
MPTLLDPPVEVIPLTARELDPGDLNFSTDQQLSLIYLTRIHPNRQCAAIEIGSMWRGHPILQRRAGAGRPRSSCSIEDSPRRRRRFHKAVLMEDEVIMQTFLECVLNPEVRNKDGWTRLVLAAAEWKTAVARILPERDDVDLKVRFDKGLTPLTAAICTGKAHIVKISRPPFRIAIENHEKTCKSLIKLLLATKRAAPNLMDSDGNTALHLSVQTLCYPATMLLPRSDRIIKAPINGSRDTPLHTATPFHLAVRQEQEGVATLLLERGASLHLKNDYDHSVAILVDISALSIGVKRNMMGYLYPPCIPI